MPPQKSIASFFARTAPKPTSGEALGPSASSPAQQSQQTAKAKAAAGSSKELVAAAKAARADQNTSPEAAGAAAAGAAADGKKRKRLRQVIEDSPVKSEGAQQQVLDDDVVDEVVPPAPAATSAPPAASTAAVAKPVAAAGAAAAAQSVQGGAGSGAAAAEAASPSAAPAASPAAGAAAAGGSGTPKKLASIFMKPQPKPKGTGSGAGSGAGTGSGAGSAAGKVAGSGGAAAKTGAGGKKSDRAGEKSEQAKKKSGQSDMDVDEDRAAAMGRKQDKEAGASDDEEDDDEEDEVEDEVEEEEEEGEGVAPAGKAGAKGRPAKKRKVEGSKVDGVGQGAIAAAAKYSTVKTEALVGDLWKSGQAVPFAYLADTFESIAETSGRLEIIHLLVNCFRAILSTTPEDLLPAVYLCTNRVAPAHMGVELGVGESILIKALAMSAGSSEAKIKDKLKEDGDLGTLAVKMRSTQKTLGMQKKLTIRGVFKTLKDIAMASGKNSQKTKQDYIVSLLANSKGNETGYIMRSLQAKLRIGLAEQSVLVALAHSTSLQRDGAKGADLADRLEKAAQVVKQCYCECPSYDVMIPALLAHPISELPQHCRFMAGVPIKPMLAKATNAVSEVLDKFQDCEFTCEYKYDGERAQLHVLENKSVLIFSRNSENNTAKYPDIVQRVHSSLQPDVKSIVIDSEAVAWDKVKKKILPFQVLSTRKRKDVDASSIDVQVCVFAFDCLYLNGRSLLEEPLEERRKALYASLKEVPGEMQFATAKTSKDLDELQRFLDEAVDACTEGLIVKTMHDAYEPSRRSAHWLKLKKDYLEGVGDTLDVVPIGAWHGKGKRTGVYGAYLLAVYDPDTETYQTICKIGTGFSEEELEQLTQRCAPHIIDAPKKYYAWHENLLPDVWLDAAMVWEIKAADLSISPVHKAAMGMVDPVKGISIRFPRLLRVREDKSPEDATSAEQVMDMYKKQAYHKADTKDQGNDDDE